MVNNFRKQLLFYIVYSILIAITGRRNTGTHYETITFNCFVWKILIYLLDLGIPPKVLSRLCCNIKELSRKLRYLNPAISFYPCRKHLFCMLHLQNNRTETAYLKHTQDTKEKKTAWIKTTMIFLKPALASFFPLGILNSTGFWFFFMKNWSQPIGSFFLYHSLRVYICV